MSSSKFDGNKQPRHKGQFVTKRKLKWLENVSAAAKRPRLREAPYSRLSQTGRRIMNLEVLADQLWCTFCDQSLSLKYIEEEAFFGLASKFQLRCHTCLAIKDVHTDSQHRTPDGNVRYSVNSKAAVGIIDAGIGHTHLNTLLSALNVPTISDTLLKRHERAVGPSVESVAKESCLKSLHLEKELTLAEKKLAPREIASEELASTEIPSKELATTEIASKEFASTEIPSKELASMDLASTEIPSKELALTDMPSKKLASTDIPSKELATTETASKELASMDLFRTPKK